MSSQDRNDPILARAAELPDEIAPQRDLWPGIAAQLDVGAGGRSRTGWRWQGALAAGVALVALTAAVTWRIAVMQSAAPPADALADLMQAGTGAALQPGIELVDMRNDLLDSLQASLSRLPPESQRIVVDNLQAIRTSLNEIEAALWQDPDDASLHQLLYTTYEQELQMLGNLHRMTQSLPVEVET